MDENIRAVGLQVRQQVSQAEAAEADLDEHVASADGPAEGSAEVLEESSGEEGTRGQDGGAPKTPSVLRRDGAESQGDGISYWQNLVPSNQRRIWATFSCQAWEQRRKSMRSFRRVFLGACS